MSLPNLSGLAHAPPRPTGAVLTVKDVKEHDKQEDFAEPETDDDGNPVVDDKGEQLLVCALMGERFFQSDDPEDLVVAIELDNCKHVFHGSFLCTKVFGTRSSAAYEHGSDGLWDAEIGNWRENASPPRCDYCRTRFAFSNIRELMTRVETCNAKGIMGDDFPREGDDRAWKDLEEKYEKWLEEEDKRQQRAAAYEARQARVAIAMSQYGMDPQDAEQWAATFADEGSADAVAAALAIQAQTGQPRGNRMDVDESGGGLPRDFYAPRGSPFGYDLSREEEAQLLPNMEARAQREKQEDAVATVLEAVDAHMESAQVIDTWNWYRENMWWATSRREIVRVFHRLTHPALETLETSIQINPALMSAIQRHHRSDPMLSRIEFGAFVNAFKETVARQKLSLYKRDHPLSFHADARPEYGMPFVPQDPDVHSLYAGEEGRWRRFYESMMKRNVPYVFGAHKQYGIMDRAGPLGGAYEQANPHFLKLYVKKLGLSSMALHRVKETHDRHKYAAWFLPHPSCWITPPISAPGKHANALCPPLLAAKLIEQEREASLRMWTWGGDPNMPKAIDIQAQFSEHKQRAWNLFGQGKPPRNKDYMKHIFQLEYDDLPRPENLEHWPRCCHMHVGVTLEGAVRSRGVVYLKRAPEVEGGRCRNGYSLFQGPPLVVTLSVPYSLTRNKMPMAVDVVNFLHTYASSAASTQAEIKNRYGLSRFEETIERHLPPIQDPLLENGDGNDDRVQVIRCRMQELRYQILDSEAAAQRGEDRQPITVPIETYLRNGIATLLRDPGRGGMIARAFGFGPWLEWHGGDERQPSDSDVHNKQGVLATILANDLRRSRSWGEQLSPIKYKIRGVVNGRTVVMRDRPRYSNADAAGNVEIDPTDPSRTEPADTVYRDRERYPNIMACAELVLENDQYFMPWHRS